MKRSPVDLRPPLGIPAGLSAATLAHAISAYSRGGFLPAPESHARLSDAIERLELLRCAGYPEPCWGYHFDVQTRVFFYPSTDPNTIATAFAGLALLDAYELTGHERALELARGAGDFFLNHVPQTDGEGGAFFGYLAGDRTPIHNANVLVCQLLARLSAHDPRPVLAERAATGIAYTIAHQRADGSWPYGELPHLDWVDGFHTGYVLDCLRGCLDAGIDSGQAQGWERGLHFYARELFLPGGAPKYTPAKLYPIDSQCAAQGIQTLAIAGRVFTEYRRQSWTVFRYVVERLQRRDGAFVFQRRRYWTNDAPHPRWVQAPMLAALTHLLDDPLL